MGFLGDDEVMLAQHGTCQMPPNRTPKNVFCDVYLHKKGGIDKESK